MLKTWKFKFKSKELIGTRPQVEHGITWEHCKMTDVLMGEQVFVLEMEVVQELNLKSVHAIELSAMENVLIGKGLSGLSLCVKVWEPGGDLTKLANWKETCHVNGWLMRVIGVANQNASLLSVVGVMNLASHKVFEVVLLEMQEWFSKTCKYMCMKREQKECTSLHKGTVEESMEIGQSLQEDLSSEDTREGSHLYFYREKKYIQSSQFSVLEDEDQMVQIDIEEKEFHDKQPHVSGSDGKQGLGSSNYWISKIEVVEIHTQHVLLKDSLYYLAAEKVYRERVETLGLTELKLHLKNGLHSVFGSDIEVAKQDDQPSIFVVSHGEAITWETTTTSKAETIRHLFENMQLRGRKMQRKIKQQKLLKSWRFKFKNIAAPRYNKTRNDMIHVALTSSQSLTLEYRTIGRRSRLLSLTNWCECRQHSSVVWHQWRTKTSQKVFCSA